MKLYILFAARFAGDPRGSQQPPSDPAPPPPRGPHPPAPPSHPLAPRGGQRHISANNDDGGTKPGPDAARPGSPMRIGGRWGGTGDARCAVGRNGHGEGEQLLQRGVRLHGGLGGLEVRSVRRSEVGHITKMAAVRLLIFNFRQAKFSR